MMPLRLSAVLLLTAPALLSAQVGHDPTRTPYADVTDRQWLTAFGGRFRPLRDPAGVAPQAAMLAGLRYDLRLGGPAHLTARYQTAFSQRTVLDPTRPAATRVVGTRDVNLQLLDLGLTLALTGAKSYRGFIPTLGVGAGIVSDFAGADAGGYRFGTKFAFTGGLGVQYVTRSRWGVRGELSGLLYSLRYPATYFEAPANGTAILPANRADRSAWRINRTLTLGATYALFR
jgi:hypothetical protein